VSSSGASHQSQRRPAVFLDRDGTIIEDAGYIRDPRQVRLLPGADRAIRRLNTNGFVTLVVTNQSGIARGLLTENDYRAIQQRVDELLRNGGAHLDGHFFCPHLPEVSGPCECRKPGTLLYRVAAERFNLDLPGSWWVGDRMRDVLPAASLGGRGILVGDTPDSAEPGAALRAPDLESAVGLILSQAGSASLGSSPMTMRIAVAISGRGTNLEALLRVLGPDAPAEIVMVLSDREAEGLALARARNIPAEILDDPEDATRWLTLLRRRRADLVVLAGYLKLVPSEVIAAFRGRIINIHPALLPDFGGKGMYGRRVHEAVLASGARETGASVHLVDEGYDEGAVLAQVKIPVLPHDTPQTLAQRVLELEHRLLPAVVLAAARAGRPVSLMESKSGFGSQRSQDLRTPDPQVPTPDS
jgi:formyltetrahydrofolate-dependent phosphoribosylglycinamide formyltransferase